MKVASCYRAIGLKAKVISCETQRQRLRRSGRVGRSSFGVEEVWRFDGEHLRMYRLKSGKYEEGESSGVFPGVSAASISDLLAHGKSLGRTGWLRLARSWAHERFGKSPV